MMRLLKSLSSPVWYPPVYTAKRAYKVLSSLVERDESANNPNRKPRVVNVVNVLQQFVLVTLGTVTALKQGMILGALIGSAIPGVGTLIGGIVGGVLGAVYGSYISTIVGKYIAKAINYAAFKCGVFDNQLVISPTNPNLYQPDNPLEGTEVRMPFLEASYVTLLKEVRKQKNEIGPLIFTKESGNKRAAYLELIKDIKKNPNKFINSTEIQAPTMFGNFKINSTPLNPGNPPVIVYQAPKCQ